MKRPTVIVPFVLAAALVLTGCTDPDGGAPGTAVPDDAASSETAPEAAPEPAAPEDADAGEEPDAPEDPEAQAPEEPGEPAAVLGTVEVAGTTYEITEVRRCDPLVMDMMERDLEVQGLGEHDGQRVQIDVYIQKIADQQMDEVSWAGPEGIFGGPEGAVVDFSGDRVSGTATLLDAMTMEDTLPVTFDLEVPDEILQCH